MATSSISRATTSSAARNTSTVACAWAGCRSSRWAPGRCSAPSRSGPEVLYQQYLEPKGAYYAGAGLALRYHFLSLGRFVPYLEAAGTAGGTNLKVFEIDSTFTFVVWGGLGASFFVTDQTAIYAGYRYQHVSNGNTSDPNRGLEFNSGVFGVSYFLK